MPTQAANVAVFWGEGGAFCAGWDLKSVSDLDQGNPVGNIDFPKGGGKAPRGPLGPSRLELSKPVIAAVEGPAVAGGMELAMWSDVRVMAESAYFGVYCRRWGVPLIDGGTVRLPRLVGMGKALEIIMTGRKVTAEESLPHRPVRKGRAARQGARGGRGDGAGDRPLPAGVHALGPSLGLSRLGQVGARRPGERVGDERRTSSRPRASAAPRASPRARAATATSRTSERPITRSGERMLSAGRRRS